MKFFFDLLPVIAFFGVYKYTGDILTATATIIVTTVFQMAYTWLKHKKIEKIHVISMVLVVFLGGLTLLFEDKAFIQWKPTILYWVLAAALLISHFVTHKNLTQRALEGMLKTSNIIMTDVPAKMWEKLNWFTCSFLFFIGILNLYIAYQFSEDTWVNFKLFGLTALTMVYMVGVVMSLSRYMSEPEKNSQSISQQTKD
ncbi:septation protein A [Endozoicomonas sp. SM1973]|uniref:Inner membrane-spanning protein YciB n=1 Tax=Spartinivicinus marinus TaxID=2994442 RepID=A0A853IEI2_9GAMM|nr:septation protein A [Spartinivicinus marinus]MCX4028772.1 septation protein A [Spartinivicinus marinus]NYZ67585.1 septation protein A [Spartinivicinus marinus]